MQSKKRWQRWVVNKNTWVEEVEAYTLEEARALFDAKECVVVDKIQSVEKSDVQEATGQS